MRYTDEEYSLLEGVFKDNEALLKAITKSLLQAPLTEREEELIMQQVKGDDLKDLLRRIILPSYADGESINWMEDTLERIGGVNMPFDVRSTEYAVICIKARHKAIDYLKQEIDNLFKREEPVLRLSDLESLEDKKDTEIHTDYFARQEIVDKVKDTIKRLKTMSKGKPTDEEIAEYQRQNSAR